MEPTVDGLDRVAKGDGEVVLLWLGNSFGGAKDLLELFDIALGEVGGGMGSIAVRVTVVQVLVAVVVVIV